MQVEVSLAEMLINAIGAGRIPGVQFKRGCQDIKATFDALNAVIGCRLDSALQVARQEASRESPIRMKRALEEIIRVAPLESYAYDVAVKALR